ncbi:MAG TPA: 50S ribosomal protein L24 [Luteibaculaceae bacterium]|nr:50S ribosomal protein L24 [Luteibaculaceae bacterium]
MQAKLKIKVSDTVRVIAGDHKGKEGKVLSINRTTLRAIVEGVNIVTKHQKPSATNPQGGLVQKEASIHVSNLALLVKGNITKVGRKLVDGKIVRYAKNSKNKEVIK